MEQFEVKYNSWHFKLVNDELVDTYGISFYTEELPRDFCSYWRLVITIVLKKLIGYITLGVIFTAVLMFIIVAAIQIFNYPLMFIGMIVSISTIIGGTIFIVKIPDMLRWYKERKIKIVADDPGPPQKGIFRMKYESWKNKYCPSIHYEEINK